ncbi:hypothetical protein HNQ72_000121 [Rhizobium wenxiniae]|uniref:Uncharacterized protein n=1 Tax=Rhizobium wenxiniae TaxID=1737357 RepID=A0A7W9Y1K5_9HYPH|nr:hypothetical protein [Rhizobium wenxiniae]
MAILAKDRAISPFQQQAKKLPGNNELHKRKTPPEGGAFDRLESRGFLEANCSPSYTADVCAANAEVAQFAIGHAAELGNGFAVLTPVAEFLCDAHCGDPLPCGRHIRPLHLLIVLNVVLHKKQRPLRMPPMRLVHSMLQSMPLLHSGTEMKG